MSAFFCCCCGSRDYSNTERQPLLTQLGNPETARQLRPAQNPDTVKRTGRLLMRRVDVPELDKRFNELAECFNNHQECYEDMLTHIKQLQRRTDCTQVDSPQLAECVGKIRQEWETRYKVSLTIKGYDFSLLVVPVSSGADADEEPLPPTLQQTQNVVKYISERAKATISKGTTLQELTGWLLRSENQMADQVRSVAVNHQEQGRLKENLKENMREVKRAKDLLQEYKQCAGDIITEAAEIAGASL